MNMVKTMNETIFWEAIDIENLAGRLFTTNNLVEYFLDLHNYWWSDPTNTLYNKRQEAKSQILYWLATNEELYDEDYNMIYVLSKYENEFHPHFRKIQ
jgi:hypothetical protein